MSLIGVQFGLRARSDSTGKVFRHLDLPLEIYGLFFTLGSLGYYGWHRCCQQDKDEASKRVNLLQRLSEPIPYAFISMTASFLIVCFTPETIVKGVLRSMGERALQQTSEEQKALARQALDEWGDKVSDSNDKARQTMSHWKSKLKDKF